jgi:hypothetical protein
VARARKRSRQLCPLAWRSRVTRSGLAPRRLRGGVLSVQD